MLKILLWAIKIFLFCTTLNFEYAPPKFWTALHDELGASGGVWSWRAGELGRQAEQVREQMQNMKKKGGGRLVWWRVGPTNGNGQIKCLSLYPSFYPFDQIRNEVVLSFQPNNSTRTAPF